MKRMSEDLQKIDLFWFLLVMVQFPFSITMVVMLFLRWYSGCYMVCP